MEEMRKNAEVRRLMARKARRRRWEGRRWEKGDGRRRKGK
jgi:hypothetical protein